jgi:hypothetical protein
MERSVTRGGQIGPFSATTMRASRA